MHFNITKKIQVSITIFTFLLTLFPLNVSATSNDECAIWLCLPTGFPSGCSSAHSAMMKRISHFKSPLPSLSSCLVSGSVDDSTNTDGITDSSGKGAYVKAYSYCSEWKYITYGSDRGSKKCTNYSTKEPHIVKDTTCKVWYEHRDNGGNRYDVSKNTPNYCTKTVYYTEVLIDGKLEGDTFWYDNNGNTY